LISQLLLSLRRSRPAPGAASTHNAQGLDDRLEVCPPALARVEAARPIGLRAWLGAAWRDSTLHGTSALSSAAPHRSLRQPEQRAAPLMAVRAEFVDAMADLHGPAVGLLTAHVRRARSLRELWHLRADVYSAVATEASEGEAQRRLARLNRHFATRTPSTTRPHGG